MRIRVVDYIGNGGGGVRFAAELLRAFVRRGGAVRVELVSDGAALVAYRELLGREAVDCEFVAVPPAAHDGWRVDVPAAALEGCDVVWMPWLHRHRVEGALADKVVGSFHDAIVLTEPSLREAFRRQIPDERETTARWLATRARIVVSSRATVDAMVAEFAVPASRFDVVPTSGAHAVAARSPALRADWGGWVDREFLLCPANISPHKNHETLLAGLGLWGARRPLVLTGQGADLPVSRNPVKRALRRALEPLGVVRPTRATALRRAARRGRLALGRALVPVGYVTDAEYYTLLRRAWALVMPTLAEGGGSFPVEEAMRHGVPVVCSDIAVMREHVGRVGGDVLWFDPRDPRALAAKLTELEANYVAIKARSVAQVGSLQQRTWDDVANEYWPMLTAVAEPMATR